MQIIQRLLPMTLKGKRLFSKKRNSKITSIIIHYISAINISKKNKYDFDSIYDIFKTYGLSVHYLIDRDGTVYQLVNDENKAFHAGRSILHGKRNVNDSSIGIELIGTKTSRFTDDQYMSLSQLTKELISKYEIPKENIVGHDFIAPKRKVDPGKYFKWDRFFDLVFSKKIILKKDTEKQIVESFERMTTILKNTTKMQPIILKQSRVDIKNKLTIWQRIKKIFSRGK